VTLRARCARACTSKPVEIVPDPAFMLEPASQTRRASTCAAWLSRRKAADRGDHPALVSRAGGGSFRTACVRFRPSTSSATTRASKACWASSRKSLEALRLRLDADILLLPGYTTEHEADDAACEALRWRMPGAHVRIARIAEPRLYKALLGQAAIVISARMHPLILAAGMGVPFVGCPTTLSSTGCTSSSA
jgi:polysaccharide pyruvyl transferase WcaK-like protein